MVHILGAGLRTGDNLWHESRELTFESDRNRLMASGCKDAPGCIDPELTDPEGWTCNCYDHWSDNCQSIGEAGSTDCLSASFCLSDLVCDCWKAHACVSPGVQ